MTSPGEFASSPGAVFAPPYYGGMRAFVVLFLSAFLLVATASRAHASDSAGDRADILARDLMSPF